MCESCCEVCSSSPCRRAAPAAASAVPASAVLCTRCDARLPRLAREALRRTPPAARRAAAPPSPTRATSKTGSSASSTRAAAGAASTPRRSAWSAGSRWRPRGERPDRPPSASSRCRCTRAGCASAASTPRRCSRAASPASSAAASTLTLLVRVRDTPEPDRSRSPRSPRERPRRVSGPPWGARAARDLAGGRRGDDRQHADRVCRASASRRGRAMWSRFASRGRCSSPEARRLRGPRYLFDGERFPFRNPTPSDCRLEGSSCSVRRSSARRRNLRRARTPAPLYPSERLVDRGGAAPPRRSVRLPFRKRLPAVQKSERTGSQPDSPCRSGTRMCPSTAAESGRSLHQQAGDA